jgi:hypothetical protein
MKKSLTDPGSVLESICRKQSREETIHKLLRTHNDKTTQIAKVMEKIVHSSAYEQYAVDLLLEFLSVFLARVSSIVEKTIEQYLDSSNEELATKFFLDNMGMELEEINSIHYSCQFEHLISLYCKWIRRHLGGEEHDGNVI